MLNENTSANSLAGKVALITGANTGIGRATATKLALQGVHVFLACRSRERTEAVLNEIAMKSDGKAKAEFLELDLGDLASVRSCAQQFLARNLPLNILINNAGLSGQKGITASQFELVFGTCHVGHFLLTQLLLDRLKSSAPSRVVVVASRAHTYVKTIDFDAVRKPTQSLIGMSEYGTAKLANILFAAELARRLEGTGVTTYSLHPGVVASDVWRAVPWIIQKIFKPLMLTSEQGAATSLYCATSPDVVKETGLYYDRCKVAESSAAARDHDLSKRLWVETEKWLQAS